MTDYDLIIYWTSDLHGKQKVFSFLEKIPRNEQTILLDTGDALLGSSTLFFLKEPVLKKMNKANYSAMAMGNREFHYFKNIIKSRILQASFPVISSNLEDNSEELKGISPYIKVNVNGIRIGILGLTPIQFKKESILNKLTKMRFLDYKEAIDKYIKLLKDGVDLFVILSHAGLKEDNEWLKQIEQPLIVLSGHSHKILTEPIKINNNYIFSIGAYGKCVGKLELRIEKGDHFNQIKNFKYEIIEISKIKYQNDKSKIKNIFDI